MCVYKIEEIAERVRPIAERYGISKVYLFGSYARGEATEESDVDLLVDAENVRGLFALGGVYTDLEEVLNKKIDLVTFDQLKQNSHNPIDSQFICEVETDKKEIYNADIKQKRY